MSTRKSTKVKRICERCGSEFFAFPCRVYHRGAVYCSKDCFFKGKAVLLEVRFQKYIGETTERGCILWAGGTDGKGYGIIRVGSRGAGQTPAHRLAWTITNGAIPDGLSVCHHCDTPLCINVDHLFLGTQSDNSNDRHAKGRDSKGEDHGSSKLTEKQVHEIRARYSKGDIYQYDLAREYNVCQSAISSIVLRKGWKHI